MGQTRATENSLAICLSIKITIGISKLASPWMNVAQSFIHDANGCAATSKDKNTMYATYYVANRPALNLFDLLARDVVVRSRGRRLPSGVRKPQSSPLATAEKSPATTSTDSATGDNAKLAEDQAAADSNENVATARADQPETTAKRPERPVAPRLDYEESDVAFVLRADLPGVARDAIDLQVKEQELQLEASRGDKTALRYVAHLVLPERADTNNIEARFENGVLELVIAKVAPPKAIKIAVQA
jgi:HSP20 family protein